MLIWLTLILGGNGMIVKMYILMVAGCVIVESLIMCFAMPADIYEEMKMINTFIYANVVIACS